MEQFALVDFFERSEVDVIESKHIQTKSNRSRMNRRDWDVDEEVEVPWPVNRNGKKQVKYVARVLRFGSSVTELAPYTKAAEEGKDVPLSGELVYGRGQRVIQPKRPWTSESDRSEDEIEDLPLLQQKKVKKTSRKNVGDEARELLRAQMESATVTRPGRSNEGNELEEEVKRLRRENASLRQSLAIIKELPELLQSMRELKENSPRVQLPTAVPSVLVSAVPSTPGSPTTNQLTKVIPCTPTPTQECSKKIFGLIVNDNDQVDLGYGIVVNASNLQYVTRANPQKAEYAICEVVCSREEMAACSLTGKQSNAFKDTAGKEKMNTSKVSAIIDFVQKLHPGTDSQKINKMIGVKLNIVQKLVKRRSAQETGH